MTIAQHNQALLLILQISVSVYVGCVGLMVMAVDIIVCSALDSMLTHLQEQHESAMAPQVAELATAKAAMHQLQEWRALHGERLRTDVLQAMDEASDDESVLAEGSQVNVTANAGSFSLALPERFCSSPTKERSLHQHSAAQPQEEEQPRPQRHRGLVSFIRGALRRH